MKTKSLSVQRVRRRSSFSPPVSRSSTRRRGFQNEPQRCKACRDARKNAARGPREFFTAVCAMPAAARRRFPSSPSPTVPCTAASASRRSASSRTTPEQAYCRKDDWGAFRRPIVLIYKSNLPEGKRLCLRSPKTTMISEILEQRASGHARCSRASACTAWAAPSPAARRLSRPATPTRWTPTSSSRTSRRTSQCAEREKPAEAGFF